MTTTNIGIAGSYIAKMSNVQDTLHVGDGISGPFGYQASASTTPTISMSTTFLYLSGANDTITGSFPSAVTGQTLFVYNVNSGTPGTFTLEEDVSIAKNHSGMVVYDGDGTWIKFIDNDRS
jgi:hypothetical protein